MPRPRFDKLPDKKRERILQAAAQEFARQGYDGASMNQILEVAGISKGAAYYYFDDKADLFMTAVSHYSQHMVDGLAWEVDSLTAGNFWPTLAEQYRTQFLSAIDRPWMFGLFKAAGSLMVERDDQSRLAEFSEEMQAMLHGLLARGQELGQIRTDLDDDFLYALVISIDETHDQWLLPQWPEMNAADVDPAVERIIDLLQRILSPKS